MELTKILNELKEEIHYTITGSFAQGGTKEDIETMIHNIIEDDFEKIMKKFEITGK